ATAVTEIASGLARSVVRRPIDFIHLPVPRRADDGYFTPLKVLERQEGTALYLGLVHLSDGLEGTMLRIAAAERVGVGNFGVATECGWGRCRPEEMTKLLQLHQAVSQPVHCH
ncbi:MAG: hypothetical protein ACREN8_11475, partial [Candidatus Dormibacteraceae bacterium]